MELKSLLAPSKEITVDYPEMPGFKVKVAYLSKDQLRALGKKAKTIGFDRQSRQATETLDEELFNKIYIEKALVGWEGLKYSYLEELVLLNEESEIPEEGELDFSLDNAVTLVSSSREFDSWLTSVVSDISLFNKRS